MYELFSIALISLFGAMSPGPDFAIVTRYALTGSRIAALFATAGIASALLVHVTYCSLGIALLIAETPLLFRLIQIAGSCYLGYLGVRLLLPAKKSAPVEVPSPKHAYFSGFITNLLNPKATLFILSIYTQFVDPKTPFYMLALYGLAIASTALIWFSTLSFLITHRFFLPHFAKFQKILSKVMGILLLLLASWVVISTFKASHEKALSALPSSSHRHGDR